MLSLLFEGRLFQQKPISLLEVWWTLQESTVRFGCVYTDKFTQNKMVTVMLTPCLRMAYANLRGQGNVGEKYMHCFRFGFFQSSNSLHNQSKKVSSSSVVGNGGL